MMRRSLGQRVVGSIKWVLTAGAMLAVLAALAAGTSSLWLPLVEHPPMWYTNLPYPVLNGPMPVGVTPLLEVARCAERPLLVRTSRTFREVDTNMLWYVGDVLTDVPEGCVTVKSSRATLPLEAPPGRYVLHIVSEVPGKWQKFYVRGVTDVFEVVGRAADRQ